VDTEQPQLDHAAPNRSPLFHFPTWAKARAMQHWIDRSGIARRPMPKTSALSLEWFLSPAEAKDVIEAS